MKTAGIREARQALSVLLEDVRKGHEIVITDRGRPVARLVPPQPLSTKPFTGRAAFRRRMKALRGALGDDGRSARAPWPRDLPGPLYVSASVLARLYAPAADSDRIEAALKGRRDLTVSDLTITEMLACFAAGADATALGEVHSTVVEDLESGIFRHVEIVPAEHRAAERLLLSGARLRPTDALHLALAMTAGVASIVTLDTRLATAARALGLPAHP
jgi:prevent-host-death family protein